MLNFFLLTGFLFGQNTPMSAPPSPEVTQVKVKALNDKMQEIKEKTEKLNAASVKLEVQGDKNVESFVEDSIFILKLRADILIQLVDVFEEALTARYNLEATLEEYKNWIKNAMGGASIRNKKFEDKASSLEKENKILLDEATIITDIIQRKLKLHIDTVSTVKIEELKNKIEAEMVATKKADLKLELRKLESQNTKFEINFKLKSDALLDKNNKKISLVTIENRNEIEKKYDVSNGSDPELAIQDLESKLEEIKNKYSLNKYEIITIKNDFLKSDDAYLNKLRVEQKRLIEQSNSLLEQTKDYSFRAQKIYIASKYVKIMIDEARMAGGDISNIAIALDNTIKNEPIISSALEAATGQATVVEDLRDLINKRFENDKESTNKDPKIKEPIIEKGSDKEKKDPSSDKSK